MSKSEESDYSRINLKDSPDEIIKKIKKAKSDSDHHIPDNLKVIRKKTRSIKFVKHIFRNIKNNLEKILKKWQEKIILIYQK